MKHSIVFLFSILSALAQLPEDFDGSWYAQPAKSWEREALPIGNGYMGAMVFGKIAEEEIQFNEKTLWEGGIGEWADYNGGNYRNRAKYLKEIQQLFRKGKDKEAAALASKQLVGNQNAYGAYQNFGSLFIKTGHDNATDYLRSLDLKKAEARISYDVDGVTFTRSHFASYPDRLIAHQFKASRNGSLNLDITFQSAQVLTDTREIPDGYSYTGHVHKNKMKWQTKLIAIHEGGTKDLVEGRIIIKDANCVTLYQVAATEYKQTHPDYRGTDYAAICTMAIEQARKKGFDQIRQAHQADHRALYDRVKLQLAGTNDFKTPTDQRIANYKQNRSDRGLEVLLFNFGRYMMIASSRPGSLPANLQGAWNNSNNPQWCSDYHGNINLQMNYWMTETTNLAECAIPLIEFVDSLREPGRITAREYYGTEGWVAHTMINTFGFTAPGWNFNWGYAPNAAAWLSRHTWEHYNFGRDKDYLKHTAYPILKEAALFWEQYLIEDTDGTLVSSPSYSPEHGPITVGCTMDQQVAHDVFTICIEAAEILGTDTEKVALWKDMRSRLSPLKIGKHGQLQEWKKDIDDPNDKHRHVNHLYGLHPGRQISPLKTPELAEAAKVTLTHRGDGGTGWSLAWKINFWARLLDGDRAHTLFGNLLSDKILPNLLDTHPPFQIDGNFGATNAVAEMLVQSHTNIIELLPALPSAWSDGHISGLRARGNVVVDLKWERGKLVTAKFTTASGGTFELLYKGSTKSITLEADQPRVVSF